MMKTATDTPAAAPQSTARPPLVAPRFIPARAAAIEADLAARFLGDDLAERCAFAAAFSDPLFLATAALPLESRREAATAWRKRTVEQLAADSPPLREFIDAQPVETREAIRAGEMPLAELDGLAADFHEIRHAERMERLNASKQALRRSIHAALGDGGDIAENGAIVPGAAVILESGEVKLFRRRIAATEWARAAGCRYMLAEFNREAIAIHPGAAVE